MGKVYIAIKKFGGGRKLSKKYGQGVGRMVQMGTKINEEDFNGAEHRKELENMGLVEEFDPKKEYRTQADRELLGRRKTVGEKKSDGGTKDDKSGKKDKG